MYWIGRGAGYCKGVLDIMVLKKLGWVLCPIFMGYGYDGEVLRVMLERYFGPLKCFGKKINMGI